MIREGWKKLPDRDEVLERIYEFIRHLSSENPEEAEKLVYLDNPEKFYGALEEKIVEYLSREIEDDDIPLFTENKISYLTDPEQLDEDLVFPDFSGSSMTVSEGERISLFIGFAGEVTPVRMYFSVFKSDEVYFLRFEEVTLDLFGDFNEPNNN